MKRLVVFAAGLAALAAGATPAQADRGGRGYGWGHERWEHNERWERGYYRPAYYAPVYYRPYPVTYRPAYYPVRYSYYEGIPYWRTGGRYYCRRSDGTTGLLVGGAFGAVVGRGLSHRHDRAAGTILGAAAGALIGQSLDRGSAYCN